MENETIRAMRAELDDVRTELARLRVEQRVTARRQMVRGARQRWLAATALAMVLLVLAAPALLATDRFTDVADDHPHHDDIAAIAAAGITRGCDPPDNTAYCPDDYVTRGQMASFLARTGGLGGNPPVANAARLNGRTVNDLARVTYAQATIRPVTSTRTSVATITIEAPSAGLVLVTGMGQFFIADLPSATCPCDVSLSVRDDSTGRRSYPFAFAEMQKDANLSVQQVYGVQPGTRTFSLEVVQQSGEGMVTLNGTITGIFVPRDPPGGAQP